MLTQVMTNLLPWFKIVLESICNNHKNTRIMVKNNAAYKESEPHN